MNLNTLAEKYEWNPAEYSRHCAPQDRAAEELLARIALRLEDAMLDLGCADGRHSASIAAQLSLAGSLF